MWDKGSRAAGFLIDGLLSSKMSILAGAPKAGKSMLSVAMVAALTEGDGEFLGHKVNRRLDKVAFVLTDPWGPEETHMRIDDLLTDPDRVYLGEIDRERPDYWDWLADSLLREGVQLLVVDNVLGAIHGDVADANDARRFMDAMDKIMRQGIAVLIVTHTAKAGGPNGSPITGSSSPIGGRIFGARPRVIGTLLNAKDKGLRLQVDTNHAEQVEIPLVMDVVNEAPRFTLGEIKPKKPKRERSGERRDLWAKLADKVLAEQPAVKSMSGLAKELAPWTDKSEHTVRARLADLIQHDGKRWVRKDAPQLALVGTD